MEDGEILGYSVRNEKHVTVDISSGETDIILDVSEFGDM